MEPMGGDAASLPSTTSARDSSGRGSSRPSVDLAHGAGRPRSPDDKQRLTQKAVADLAAQLSASERELKSSSSCPSSVADSEERDPLAAHIGRGKNGSGPGSRTGSRNGSNVGCSSTGSKSAGSSDRGHSRSASAVDRGSVDIPGAGTAGTSSSSTLDQSRTDPISIESGASRSSSDMPEFVAQMKEELAAARAGKLQSDTDLLILQQAIAEVASRHTNQMESASKQLMNSVAKASQKDRYVSELVQKVAGMEANKAQQAADLKALELEDKKLREDAAEQVDKLAEDISEMKARHAQQVEELKASLQEQKDDALMVQIEIKADKDAALLATKEKVEVLKQELRTSQEGKADSKEAQLAKHRKLEKLKVKHDAEISMIANSLDVARRELSIRDVDSSSTSAGSVTTGGQPGTKLAQVNALLESSRQQELDIAAELTQARLDLSDAREDHAKTIEDMQTRLEDANKRLDEKEEEKSRQAAASQAQDAKDGESRLKGKGQRSLKPQNVGIQLESIHEDSEEDDKNSTDSEGQDAPEGRRSQRQNRDAPDSNDDQSKAGEAQLTKTLLRSLLADEQLAHNSLKEDMAGIVALASHRIWKLQEALHLSDAERDLAKDKLHVLQSTTDEDAADVRERNSNLQSLLADAQTKCMDQEEERIQHQMWKKEMEEKEIHLDVENESLKHQLNAAMDAKTVAEGRLEDFKREVDVSERKHLAFVSNLRRDLEIARAQKSSAMPGEGNFDAISAVLATETNAISALRDELKSASEDQSILVHDMEWKEVNWQTNIQNMELNHENAVWELKRQYEAELKKVQLDRSGQLKDLQERLDSALQQIEEVQSSQTSEKVLASPEPVAAEADQSSAVRWWQPIIVQLKCPTRSAPSAPGLQSTSAYCQYVCWQVMGLMDGVTALLCNSVGFQIIEASKKACAIWGSTALHGHSLLSLVTSPSRANWLASKLKETPCESEVPGFVVKDLQCMELQSKSGTFDASIVVAHLPEETGKLPTLLAIFEQLTAPSVRRHQSRGTRSSAQSSAMSSGQSSVQSSVRSSNPPSASSSVSVSPSDSVSQVAERLYGYGH